MFDKDSNSNHAYTPHKYCSSLQEKLNTLLIPIKYDVAYT